MIELIKIKVPSIAYNGKNKYSSSHEVNLSPSEAYSKLSEIVNGRGFVQIEDELIIHVTLGVDDLWDLDLENVMEYIESL